jgi:hypothetical protein
MPRDVEAFADLGKAEMGDEEGEEPELGGGQRGRADGGP